jgi:hypothetical protein
MSIIPISPDKLLTVKDSEGNEFYFRYLTGKLRGDYQDIQDSLYSKAKKFNKEARKILSESGNKNPDEGAIAKKSLEISKRDGVITGGDEDRHMSSVIDLFLSDWKINGYDSKAGSRKPSEYFQITSMVELMGLLSDHIEELMGLTVQDKKN